MRLYSNNTLNLRKIRISRQEKLIKTLRANEKDIQ